MVVNQGDATIAVAPASLEQAQANQVELSQRVQSLAAPTSKWDKFVDVTEQGVKDIPLGMWHAVEHPLGLIENAAISIGMGAAAKVLLPESGPLGSLFAIGLGAYFAEQTAVPVYKAYKTGMNAKTMGDINLAGGQLGDAIGGMAINMPIGIYGYKLGAGIGTNIMASPKMSGFVEWKAASLNPINSALSSGIESGKASIASLWRSKPGSAADLPVVDAPPVDEVKTTTTPGGREAEAKTGQLQGHVEATDKPPVVGESDTISQPPKLPERYQSVERTYSGVKVPGISDEFLKNLQTEQGDYYGAGLQYPDVMADPQMKAYLEAHNQLTLASIDKTIYAQELANEAQASSYKLPTDWDSTAKPENAIDVTDGGDGSMRVGSKTYTLTDDGAPNRKVLVADNAHPSRSKTFISEPKDFEIQQLIQASANGSDKFAVVGSQDGASILHVYDGTGKLENQIQLPGFGTLHDVKQGASPSQLQFLYDTPISHPQVLTLDLAANKSSLSPLQSGVFDTDNFVTEKVTVPWTDREGKAQETPMYVSHSKNMNADGLNLAYRKIYGGFDVGPQYVGYSPNTASWLMRGGVTVEPVLPGDGGLGSGNYQEGLGAGIENTNLALMAITAKLQDMGISAPELNGIYGRSNGGAMVNTLLNHNPKAVGAAVSESGVNSFFDSPRANVDTGEYWKPEFGDPNKPNDIPFMSKEDPLKNLSADKTYPSTLVLIGTKDGVVNVGNGITLADIRQKMGNGETLLYSRIGEGHDPVNLNLSLQTAFLWDRLSRIKAKLLTDKGS